MTTFRSMLAVSLGGLLLGPAAAGDDTRKPAPVGTPPPRVGAHPKSAGDSTRPGGRRSGPQAAVTRHGQPSSVQNGSGLGHPMTSLRDGSAIHRGPSGKVTEVHASNGAVIWHSPTGARHFEWERPDGRLFVGHGKVGYIQRPYESHGETYVQRTYIRAGASSLRFYRPWAYQDVEYNFYVHSHTYRPAVYTWAASPFPRPVFYPWGWDGSPWFGYYVAYFQPEASYVSPAFWLADFTIATTLQLAYLAYEDPAGASVQDAIPAASALTAEGPHGMSADVKRALAEEIRRQMRQARAEQAAGATTPSADWVMPAIFTDRGPKVLLVSVPMTGVTSGNSEIPLSEGDVLGLTAPPDPGEAYTKVKLLAASGSGCPVGSVLLVPTEDLVESLNQMLATVDQGLEKLQAAAAKAKPGRGAAAFPLMPADAGRDEAFVRGARAEAQAVTEFSTAVKEADLAEQAALFLADHPVTETQAQMAGLNDQDQWAAAAARVKVHMEIHEVDRLLGKPDRQASGMDRRTYIYLKGQLKINFINGQVTEIIWY
jgi:hypothetical protein